MNPIFSVIMPLYNAGDNLAETLESVVNQSIGFRDNIQVILVNDGSHDSTEDICISFKDLYPDNIVYIKQENAGVSAARNAGIPYIKGQYVNFMDGDDLWGIDAFQLAYDMFMQNENDIDVVACRMQYFEGKEGYHRLDYKFDGGNVICDILEYPTFGQYSVSSAFCKTSALSNLLFDSHLSFGEDAKFINQIILKKMKYGLLKDADYYIRRHVDGSSLTQGKLSKPTAYIDTAQYYYKYMADLSLNKYGQIIPYLQHLLINGIKYRVAGEIPESIPPEIRNPYVEILTDLIRHIDDDVICNARNIMLYTKLYLLRQKYGDDRFAQLITIKGNSLYIANNRIGAFFSKGCLSINNVRKSIFKTLIEGSVRCPYFVENISLRATYCDKTYTCKVSRAHFKDKISYTNEHMNRIYDFTLEFPPRIPAKIEDFSWTIKVDEKTIRVKESMINISIT